MPADPPEPRGRAAHPNDYILATGAADVDRLKLLHDVYGPGSSSVLEAAGLRDGARVVVFGCGSGNMSCWIASRVGPGGSVLGLDVSPEQVAQARRQAADRGLANAEFVVADATAPGLPAGSFDLAYCRLVLMHLHDPPAGLRAMRAAVRPGGTVVCEEMDVGRAFCDPPAEALDRFVALNLALGERHRAHFRLGSSLHRLFRAAGFARPSVALNQPVRLDREGKSLLRLAFLEFAPALIAEGLATRPEVDAVANGLARLEDDEQTLLGHPPLGQVWATRDG